METTTTYSAEGSQDTLMPATSGTWGNVDGRWRWRLGGGGDMTLCSPLRFCLACFLLRLAAVRDMKLLWDTRLGMVVLNALADNLRADKGSRSPRSEQSYCFFRRRASWFALTSR